MATSAEITAAKNAVDADLMTNAANTAEDVRNAINEAIDIVDTDADIEALARGAVSINAGQSGVTYNAQTGLFDFSNLRGGGATAQFGIQSFVANKGSDTWRTLAAGDDINGTWTLRFTFENITTSDPGNNPTYIVRLNGAQVGSGTADKSIGQQNKSLTLSSQPALVEGSTYSLSLTATFGMISDTLTITRRIPVTMYYGLFASNMPTKSQVTNSSSTHISSSNRLTFGRATNQYIGIYQPPGQTDLTAILTDGFNSIGGYTKVNDPFGDGSYEGWISNRAFTFPTGRVVEIRRS